MTRPRLLGLTITSAAAVCVTVPSGASSATAATWPIESAEVPPVVVAGAVVYAPKSSGPVIRLSDDGSSDVIHQIPPPPPPSQKPKGWSSEHRQSIWLKASGGDIVYLRRQEEVHPEGTVLKTTFDLSTISSDSSAIRGPRYVWSDRPQDSFDVDDGHVAFTGPDGIVVYRASEGEAGVETTLDYPAGAHITFLRIAGRYVGYVDRSLLVVHDWVANREVVRSNTAREILNFDVDADGTALAFVHGPKPADRGLISVSPAAPEPRPVPATTSGFELDRQRLLGIDDSDGDIFLATRAGLRTIAGFGPELGVGLVSMPDLGGSRITWLERVCDRDLQIRVVDLEQTSTPVKRNARCPVPKRVKRHAPTSKGLLSGVRWDYNELPAASDGRRYFAFISGGRLRAYDAETERFKVVTGRYCSSIAGAAFGRVVARCESDAGYTEWHAFHLVTGRSVPLGILGTVRLARVGKYWVRSGPETIYPPSGPPQIRYLFANVRTAERRAMSATARSANRDVDSSELRSPPRGLPAYEIYEREGGFSLVVRHGTGELLVWRRGQRKAVLSGELVLRGAATHHAVVRLQDGVLSWLSKRDGRAHLLDLRSGRRVAWGRARPHQDRLGLEGA